MNATIKNAIENKESRLILVYGRPAQGKTTYISELIIEAAEKNKKVAFISLEMSMETWKRKMSVNLNEEIMKNIDIYDNPETIGSVQKMNECLNGKGYDIIVVDYLELINTPCRGSVDKQLPDLYISVLKWKCPVVAVSQKPKSADPLGPYISGGVDEAEKFQDFILVEI